MTQADVLAEAVGRGGDPDAEARELLARLRRRMFARAPTLDLGRYRELERIGAGGMGIVYRAWDPRLQRHVAIKVLRARTRDAGLCVLREARALARLSHPNVVQVLDAGTQGDDTWIAMELVDGQTLARWLGAQRSWRAIVAAFVAAGRGLAAAHGSGVVHRDFKPSNAIVGADGRARVTDFGVASILRADDTDMGSASRDGSPSCSTAVVGTLGYAAPEQLHAGPIDARADQFALCAALHEALHGVLPFPTCDADSYATSIATGRRATTRRRVSARVDRVLAHGLAFAPADRFADMDALLRALERAARPVRAAPVVIAGALAVVGVAALAGASLSPASMCPGAAELAAQWNDDARAHAREAFIATELSYAEAAFDRVDNDLQAWTSTWVETYDEACAAGDDAALACLRRGHAGFVALSGALAHADARTVEHAHASIAGLPDCSTDRHEPPASNAVADRIAVVRALVALGDFAGAARELDDPTLHPDVLTDERLVVEVSHERARVAYFVGDLQAAEDHARAAWVAAIEVGDDKAAAVDASLLVVLTLGRPDEATRWEGNARAALARWGGGDSDEAYVHMRLGTLARARGELEAARELMERAVASLERVDPADPLRTSDALTGLGIVLGDLGRHREALAVFDRAKALLVERLPAGHPKFIAVLISRGVVAMSTGGDAEAEADWREALRIAEAIGPDHHQVGVVTSNLGGLLHRHGRNAEAKPVLLRSVAILERALGPDHPDLATPLLVLAGVHAEQGEHATAIALTERAIVIVAAVHGEDHPQTAMARIRLGELRFTTGDVEGARGPLERAHEVLTRQLGPDHPQLAILREQLAIVHAELGTEREQGGA